MRGIYISIDIEADGPAPGLNNMLSFGAAAFDLYSAEPRTPLGTFQANLELLPGVTPSAATMSFWARNPEAWAACRTDPQDPKVVMPQFLKWCEGYGKPTLIGYPVTFDFGFISWYTHAFGGLVDGVDPCFGFQGLDIKTLAAFKLGIPFRQATKRNMPKSWFEGTPKHNHIAITDAIEQGILFVNMMQDTVPRDEKHR